MQIITFLLGALLVGVGLAVPKADTSIFARSLGLCKSPSCTSQCPDGTPYDCCVTYIRDPCSDHYECDFNECVCECEKIPATYLCNANYFRDPCSPINPTHPLPIHTHVLPSPPTPTACGNGTVTSGMSKSAVKKAAKKCQKAAKEAVKKAAKKVSN